MFIDLDGFKAINDTLGHEAGDGVLVSAARRIGGGVRVDDLAARLGGDEFAVLLTDIDDTAAYAIAARITDDLARPTVIAGLPVRCRASVGVATASRPHDYALVMRRADDALYAAKADGKGQWRPYQPAMRSPMHRGSDLRTELERVFQPDADAPAARGLTMHYQPIIELTRNTTRGFEALIRWRHPDRGMIPVPELISVAERTGLIVPLGNWALHRALIDATHLTTAPDGAARYVSVNIAPRQLRQTGFTTQISNAVSTAHLDPTRLVIEITETQLLADDDDIWNDLADLRHAGMRIAIDDFGTGHASLNYLRHPVIDIVKLDRVFLRDTTDSRSRSLLRAVVALTRDLGIELIAEGIEDNTTRTTLTHLGVHLGQGHLFAPAMPIADARQWTPPQLINDGNTH